MVPSWLCLTCFTIPFRQDSRDVRGASRAELPDAQRAGGHAVSAGRRLLGRAGHLAGQQQAARRVRQVRRG